MVTQALWLVSVSVAFGALSGTVWVITGLRGHSLSVFAVGLGVLADVTGSPVLIWRFAPSGTSPGVWHAGNAGRRRRVRRPGRRQRRAHRRVGHRARERLPSRHGRHHPDRRRCIARRPCPAGLRQAPSGHADGQPRAARRWGAQRDQGGHQPAGAHLPRAVPWSPAPPMGDSWLRFLVFEADRADVVLAAGGIVALHQFSGRRPPSQATPVAVPLVASRTRLPWSGT